MSLLKVGPILVGQRLRVMWKQTQKLKVLLHW